MRAGIAAESSQGGLRPRWAAPHATTTTYFFSVSAQIAMNLILTCSVRVRIYDGVLDLYLNSFHLKFSLAFIYLSFPLSNLEYKDPCISESELSRHSCKAGESAPNICVVSWLTAYTQEMRPTGCTYRYAWPGD